MENPYDGKSFFKDIKGVRVEKKLGRISLKGFRRWPGPYAREDLWAEMADKLAKMIMGEAEFIYTENDECYPCLECSVEVFIARKVDDDSKKIVGNDNGDEIDEAALSVLIGTDVLMMGAEDNDAE